MYTDRAKLRRTSKRAINPTRKLPNITQNSGPIFPKPGAPVAYKIEGSIRAIAFRPIKILPKLHRNRFMSNATFPFSSLPHRTVEGKRKRWEGAGGREKLLGPHLVFPPSRIPFKNERSPPPANPRSKIESVQDTSRRATSHRFIRCAGQITFISSPRIIPSLPVATADASAYRYPESLTETNSFRERTPSPC